jgi:hypothetical protein
VKTANRILAVVVGLILAGLGICGILINTGHMPGTDRDVTIWTDAFTRRLHDWSGWVTAVGIVGGLIVAIIGLTLLRAELRWRGRPSVSELELAVPDAGGEPADGRGHGGHAYGREAASSVPTPMPGKTRVAGSTLRRALQADLQNNPTIKHAAVRITGDVHQPRIDLQIEVRRGTALPAVQSYVAEAFARFRETSQLELAAGKTTISVE